MRRLLLALALSSSLPLDGCSADEYARRGRQPAPTPPPPEPRDPRGPRPDINPPPHQRRDPEPNRQARTDERISTR